MLRGKGIWLAGAVGLLTAGKVWAADAPDTAAVLGKVHRSNQKEIEMGKMANVKTIGPDNVLRLTVTVT